MTVRDCVLCGGDLVRTMTVDDDDVITPLFTCRDCGKVQLWPGPYDDEGGTT